MTGLPPGAILRTFGRRRLVDHLAVSPRQAARYRELYPYCTVQAGEMRGNDWVTGAVVSNLEISLDLALEIIGGRNVHEALLGDSGYWLVVVPWQPSEAAA